MSMASDRRETKEILEDARRLGKVPVSVISLKALALLLCFGSALYVSLNVVRSTKQLFEQGTIAKYSLGSFPTNELFIFILAVLSCVLGLGLLQTRFFISFDPIVPHVPKFGEPFSIRSILSRTINYAIAMLLSVSLVLAAFYKLAPLFMAPLAAPLKDSPHMLTKVITEISIGFCLVSGAVILLSILLNRVFFISRHR